MSKQTLEEWLSIELIAERTTVIGNFIYFPFIIMFLLAMAPPPLLRQLGLSDRPHHNLHAQRRPRHRQQHGVAALGGDRQAGSHQTAGGQIIRAGRTREAPDMPEVPETPRTPDEARQRQELEWAIEAIKNNHRGAFLPFTQHPVFGAAVALPSGAYGVVLLAEYLATGFGG